MIDVFYYDRKSNKVLRKYLKKKKFNINRWRMWRRTSVCASASWKWRRNRPRWNWNWKPWRSSISRKSGPTRRRRRAALAIDRRPASRSLHNSTFIHDFFLMIYSIDIIKAHDFDLILKFWSEKTIIWTNFDLTN